MKMIKSLLLGSAAGLMAVAGAQAADLSVKAAPVEYVKVCTGYGAGFYYLPGTDICVKIGAFVRGQYYLNNGSSPSAMALFSSGHSTRVEDVKAGGDDNRAHLDFHRLILHIIVDGFGLAELFAFVAIAAAAAGKAPAGFGLGLLGGVA